MRTYCYVRKNTVIVRSAKVSKDSIIGNYTYIGDNCIITKASIGNYCSIAPNVAIGLWEHNLTKFSTSGFLDKKQYVNLTHKECIINNDVWIGTWSIIRRWVTIWNGAVIGANSFVNSDIPPFAIAVWSPAKVIRYRFNENTIERINKSEWWNKNHNFLFSKYNTTNYLVDDTEC